MEKTKFKFQVNQICFDIGTYCKAEAVRILECWEQAGYNYYLIEEVDYTIARRVLREKDLIAK